MTHFFGFPFWFTKSSRLGSSNASRNRTVCVWRRLSLGCCCLAWKNWNLDTFLLFFSFIESAVWQKGQLKQFIKKNIKLSCVFANEKQCFENVLPYLAIVAVLPEMLPLQYFATFLQHALLHFSRCFLTIFKAIFSRKKEKNQAALTLAGSKMYFFYFFLFLYHCRVSNNLLTKDTFLLCFIIFLNSLKFKYSKPY